MNLKVTVIVPVWRGERTISALLAALRTSAESSGLAFEVLIVDNGSDDETLALAKAFAARDPDRWRVLEEAKPGSYAARNRGLRDARGEQVLFTDADCRPDEDWVATLSAALDDATSAFVGGPVVAESDQRSWLAEYARRAQILGQQSALARGFLQTANLGVRRTDALAVEGFDEGLLSGGDADFCWRLGRERALRAVLLEAGQVRHTHRESLTDLARQYRRYGQSDVDLARRHGWSPPREVLRLGLDGVRVVGAPLFALMLTPLALVARDRLLALTPLLRALRIVARRRGQWIAWRSPARRHRA